MFECLCVCLSVFLFWIYVCVSIFPKRLYHILNLIKVLQNIQFSLVCCGFYIIEEYDRVSWRETSRDALLEFIVSTKNLSVCLCLKCNQTKLYTKKFDGLLVNDDKIVNLSKQNWIYFLLKNDTWFKKIIVQNSLRFVNYSVIEQNYLWCWESYKEPTPPCVVILLPPTW